MMHLICTRLWPGHLNILVGDSFQCSEETVKSETTPFNVITTIIFYVMTTIIFLMSLPLSFFLCHYHYHFFNVIITIIFLCHYHYHFFYVITTIIFYVITTVIFLCHDHYHF